MNANKRTQQSSQGRKLRWTNDTTCTFDASRRRTYSSYKKIDAQVRNPHNITLVDDALRRVISMWPLLEASAGNCASKDIRGRACQDHLNRLLKDDDIMFCIWGTYWRGKKGDKTLTVTTLYSETEYETKLERTYLQVLCVPPHATVYKPGFYVLQVYKKYCTPSFERSTRYAQSLVEETSSTCTTSPTTSPTTSSLYSTPAVSMSEDDWDQVLEDIQREDCFSLDTI